MYLSSKFYCSLLTNGSNAQSKALAQMTKLNDSKEEKVVTSEESMRREMDTLLTLLFAGSSV